jgi:hypothetical protein
MIGMVVRTLQYLRPSARRARRQCFHHDPVYGRSWLESALVDGGRAKHYWCTVCTTYWT